MLRRAEISELPKGFHPVPSHHTNKHRSSTQQKGVRIQRIEVLDAKEEKGGKPVMGANGKGRKVKFVQHATLPGWYRGFHKSKAQIEKEKAESQTIVDKVVDGLGL